MKTLHTHLASLVIVAALGASLPALANHPSASGNLGTAVHDGAANRTIVIDPGTKWVNVKDGETIKFVVRTARGEESFAWRFDTFNQPVIELNKIAPTGMLGDRSTKVYVRTQPDA